MPQYTQKDYIKILIRFSEVVTQMSWRVADLEKRLCKLSKL